MIDATHITGTLWVGGAPAPGNYAGNFDVIAFAAAEYQPPAAAYPGVRVRHVPFDDRDPPTREDVRAAWEGAAIVARDLAKGRRVLVTCHLGRNRSALVAALALHLVTGMSGVEAGNIVRRKRRDRHGVRALANEHFRVILKAVPATL